MPRTALNEGDAGKRRFSGGQPVPYDGVFADLWGGCLPLLQGDRFPSDPDMGGSKWTYAGPLSAELPVLRPDARAGIGRLV